MEKAWRQLYAQCLRRWTDQGLAGDPLWPEFRTRLDAEFSRLAALLWRLYGSRPDFAYQVETLVAGVFAAHRRRPEALRERDRTLPPESAWFLSEKQVGAVAYADLFAGTFKGVAERIPYLKELGISYLHLMPFFRSPEKENDGGYAVSSYRETNPALGSMADLKTLAAKLAAEGIVLVADFIFNHTSDEHEWALKAKAGQEEFQDYYWLFADHGETARYQAHLRDIFPEVRTGSFTWNEELKKWVWTTFNSYQWDLNYRNPGVFGAMAGEMIGLANAGIGILRLDAVAFVWKEVGTSCENREEAHVIIQAFQAVARLACPSLLFKSEAIVHPDDIEKYIDPRECRLSYNPLLMAGLWEAAATKEVRLLALSLRKRHHLPEGTAWVNYVRCHDDIGWTFADEDAAELGIKGHDHRAFLNSFYLGEFPGSFSRGVSFQYNPATGDRRICGTAASLAGVEGALESGRGEDLDRAIRRVHRPRWSDEAFRSRNRKAGVEGRVFAGLKRLSAARRGNPVLAARQLVVADSGHPSVLVFHKQGGGRLLTVIGNFSESPVVLPRERVERLLAGRDGRDLLSGNLVLPGEDLPLESCGLYWLLTATD